MIEQAHRLVRLAAVTLLTLLVVPGAVRAQIPDEFTNLQILPEDIEKRELVNIMRGFAGALGERCTFCHVGDVPGSLEGVDFATDDNEHKKIARSMMRMVMDINETHLAESGVTDPLEVRCVTCHRGVSMPETLDRMLLQTIEAEGVPAAIDRYREVRDEHYGGGTYDFGPGTLNHVAETHAGGSQDLEGAIALLELNVEFNPDAAYSHMMLGQLHAMNGDVKAATASIERALELEPDNPRAMKLLEQIQAPE